MKNQILVFVIATTLFLNNTNANACNDIEKVNADSLIANIDKYINTKVEIEGTIVHVCGVDSLKMKLKTKSGAIIKIVSSDSHKGFSKSLYNKKIKVLGVVSEARIEKPYIERVEKERLLLCHIDNMPCKDSAWAGKLRGTAEGDSLSKRSATKMRNKIEQSSKNYISVVTITAEKYEVIDELSIKK